MGRQILSYDLYKIMKPVVHVHNKGDLLIDVINKKKCKVIEYITHKESVKKGDKSGAFEGAVVTKFDYAVINFPDLNKNIKITDGDIFNKRFLNLNWLVHLIKSEKKYGTGVYLNTDHFYGVE
jgi:hypothetical protein